MTTRRALAAQIEAFLRFKRSTGCKYVRAEFWLNAFCRFVRRDSGSTARLEDLARAWLARNDRRKAVSVAYELSVLRQFFVYLKRSDLTVIVPDSSWARRSTSEFLPHILDAKDIKSLLAGAERLRFPIMRAVYRALLLVLYCTGLRFGEAVRLRFGGSPTWIFGAARCGSQRAKVGRDGYRSTPRSLESWRTISQFAISIQRRLHPTRCS